MSPQQQLWCLCGRAARSRCTQCRRRERLSREMFAGQRDRVLARDGNRCQCCAEIDQILVHHRRRGTPRAQGMITLCRRCHVRVHATHRARYGWPALLYVLWREQHRQAPEQRELALFDAEMARNTRVVQAVLFEAA